MDTNDEEINVNSKTVSGGLSFNQDGNSNKKHFHKAHDAANVPGSEQHTEDKNGEEDSGEESAEGQQFNQHAKRAAIREEMDCSPGGSVKTCLTCLQTGHTQGHCHKTTYEDGSPIVRCCSRCGRANHTKTNCSAIPCTW